MRLALRALFAALFSLAVVSTSQAQLVASSTVSDVAAQALGLTRAWATPVSVDVSRGRIVGLVLHKNILFASTSQGNVQAIDALTGATYWTVRVGQASYVTLPPGANDNFVVVTNGTTVYALERRTGRLEFERTTKGAPSAGPGLSDTHAYIPMYSGAIESYRLRDDTELDRSPTIFFSGGMPLAAPIIRGSRIYWTSRPGYIYADDSDSSESRIRFSAADKIYGQVALYKPALGEMKVLAGSHDGSVYAVNDPSGLLNWRYQSGAAVIQPPVVITDSVFVTNELGLFSRVDASNGVMRWQAPGVWRFVAASPTRVYGMDDRGQLVALDAATGGYMGSAFAGTTTIPFINDQNDRIYLVSTNGMIQCLHERGLTSPVTHAAPAAPAAPIAPGAPAEAATQ